MQELWNFVAIAAHLCVAILLCFASVFLFTHTHTSISVYSVYTLHK